MPARVLGVGVRVAAANIWTAIQTFGSGLLKLRNPAGTFTYVFKGGAIVADRDVTMPLLTGNDVLVTEGMAQTLSNKTLVAPALGTPASGTLTNATGLPVAGIAASTTTALGVGSVELGHATDTTLTRVSAGVVAVEGVTLVDLSSAQTLTTKTLTAPAISQVVFPATQAASADANTLDDYEEGVWTPTLIGSTTPGAQTYTTQVGRYVKVGSLVVASCEVVISAKDAGIVGRIQVGGLPFASENVTESRWGGGLAFVVSIDLSANYTQYTLHLNQNVSAVDLLQSGDNQIYAVIDVAAMAATAQVAMTISYRTA